VPQKIEDAYAELGERAAEYAGSVGMLSRTTPKGTKYFFKVGPTELGFGVFDRSDPKGTRVVLEVFLDAVRAAGRSDLAELLARRLERLGASRTTTARVQVNVLTALRQWADIEEQVLAPIVSTFGPAAPTEDEATKPDEALATDEAADS
jgi:hypothetical protein